MFESLEKVHFVVCFISGGIYIYIYRNWMLEEISLSIKMFLVEKGMMHMEPDQMVEETPLA
jgi:hypothetical protein